MPIKANLPAGFEITSINGKRCTKVPRSLTTIAGETSFATTTTEAAAHTTSTTPPPETSIPSAQAQGDSPQAPVSVGSTLSTTPTTSIASTAEPETTTSSTPPPAAATTSLAPVEAVTPAAASSTSTSETSTAASPASKGTTPTVFSSTPLAILQSELSATSTSTQLSGIFDNGFPSIVSASSTTAITATATSAHAEESAAAAAGISSNPRLTAAPVVGGVMGGLAILSLLGILLWVLRRRRRRVSLLTPLSSGTKEGFYSIDRESVGPTKRSVKWKGELSYQTKKIQDKAMAAIAGLVGIGASLKSKVVGDRSDTPSVNLNRGNSQFLDGPVPQHSRNNSSLLATESGNPTVKDRFNDWWESFTESMNFNWRLRQKDRQSIDEFSSARSMKERQATINQPPDFSQLLGMDDRELQFQAEGRRASLSQSLPQLGSLGLDFSALQDPFVDPPRTTNPNTTNQPWAPPNPISKPSTNPFADPQPPSRSIPKPSTYINDIRRSRGLSMDTTPQHPSKPTAPNPYLPPATSNKTSANPVSRYPSSIAPSRDSYRDTVLSSFTTTTRKGKGRSDPFDLERPELWMSKTPSPPMPEPRESTRAFYPNPLQISPPDGQTTADTTRGVGATSSRILSTSGTFASEYSSGVDSDWGDPGPDMGPGSAQMYRQDGEGFPRGSLAEMSPADEMMMGWDRLRNTDNVSPMSVESKVSSTGGVGKAR